jgi:integrase
MRQYKAFEASVNFDVNDEWTISDLLNWYMMKFEGKQTTLNGYKSASISINKIIGKRRASELKLHDIDLFIAKQKSSYSPKTIKNQISLLNSAYKDAIRRGILTSNPCEYATIPRQVKPQIATLSEPDLAVFIKALDDTDMDFRVMCELALFCGLRRSEILGLKYYDITDQITIDKVRHRINGKDIIETPKTISSIRTLSVPKFIQEHIKELKTDQSSRPFQSDFLIQNPFGEPVSQSWVRSHLDSLIKNHELPPITMHGLRHTYASMLINRGIPIAEVSAQLGHSSIDITLRTYTHLFSEPSTASKRISDLFDEEWHQNDTRKKEKTL